MINFIIRPTTVVISIDGGDDISHVTIYKLVYFHSGEIQLSFKF